MIKENTELANPPPPNLQWAHLSNRDTITGPRVARVEGVHCICFWAKRSYVTFKVVVWHEHIWIFCMAIHDWLLLVKVSVFGWSARPHPSKRVCFLLRARRGLQSRIWGSRWTWCTEGGHPGEACTTPWSTPHQQEPSTVPTWNKDSSLWLYSM